jgi:Xaa-Pro dipeptidase
MRESRSKADWAEIYRDRRNRIRQAVDGGVILWLGHSLQPRNYKDNTYPFRQNSHFLYYAGISIPDLALLTYPERDYDVLFSKPSSLEEIVWSGEIQGRVDIARGAGVEMVEDSARLGSYLAKAKSQGLKIHYLPPYQASSTLKLAELLSLTPAEAASSKSERLMEAVANQRSIKSEVEIDEIEEALDITAQMHLTAMRLARPGLHEFDIAGAMQGEALKHDRQQAYHPIVTIHGEVLHNHSADNLLEDGQLLLIDAGAESRRFYASDITRTFPVSGRFQPTQAEIYGIVLRAGLGAVEIIKAGMEYRDVHRHAARIIVEGLSAMGLMKGNPDDAVSAGAHALFFPHGIGHLLGLDVHDMEDLGDIVGYPKGEARSGQFGLKYLRLNRRLESGFILTIEPGIYFIPALIDRWWQERIHREFINYDKLESFKRFGGIRTEDNILVAESGFRVLGPGIPKTIDAVESVMAR